MVNLEGLRTSNASDRRADHPTFTPAALARFLRLPVGTVRWWALGTTVHPSPIRIADPHQHLMSFRNLVEVHVLAAVMGDACDHVPLAVARSVLRALGERFASEHPLADARMETCGKELLAASVGALTHGTAHDQARRVAALGLHLSRVVRDAAGEPTRLLLFTRPGRGGPGHVMIDPAVRGGSPCMTSSDVATADLAERFDAGESVPTLARRHGRTHDEIEEAIRYELLRR